MTLICLITLLGCSTSQPVIEYQTVKITPPSMLMADCLTPARLHNPATNGDLLNYSIRLQAALDACNQDKRALRMFYDEK